MSNADERLVVLLEARIAEFEKRMNQAERRGTRTYSGLQRSSRSATRQMEADMVAATNRVNAALATTTARIGAFSKAFVAGLAGGLIAGAFAGFTSNIRGVLADMSEVAKAADRVGLSTDNFQGLQHGLSLAGVEAKETANALGVFVDRLGDAQRGQGELLAALERGGVALTDQAGKMRPVIELLGEYSDLVKAAPDAAAKMALVTDAFGRGGKELVGALSGGREGLEGMIAAAKEGGFVLEESVLRRAEVLDDKFAEIQAKIGNVFKTGVVEAATFFGFVEREATRLAFSQEQAARLVGEALASSLGEQAEVSQEALGLIEALAVEYEDLAAEAQSLVPALADASSMLRGLGQEAEAQALSDLSVKIGDAARAFADGKISGDEFRAILEGVATEAVETIGQMEELDRVRLSGVTGAVQDLLAWIQELPAAAAAAREEIIALESVGMDTGTPLSAGGDFMPPGEGAVTSSIRPRAAPAMLGEPEAPGRGRGGGGGGGGRGSRRIEALLADLQTEREILQAWYEESLALLEGASEAELAALGGRHEALERLEAEHMERLRGIREEGQNGILAISEGFFGAMAELASAGGAKMAKAARVFGALEAAANVGRAQAQVLADPRLSTWQKVPAMLKIGAAGARIVQAIKGGSVSSGGGSGGGSAAQAPARESQGPLRVLWEGIEDEKLYEGRAIRRLYDAMAKEAGDRGVVFVGARA